MSSVPGMLLQAPPAARPTAAGASARPAAGHGFADLLSASAAKSPGHSEPVSRDTRDLSRDPKWHAQGKHLEKSVGGKSSPDETDGSVPDEKEDPDQDSAPTLAGFLQPSAVPLVVTVRQRKGDGESAETAASESTEGGHAKTGRHAKAPSENTLRETRRNGDAKSPPPVDESEAGNKAADAPAEVKLETVTHGANSPQSAAKSLQTILAQMSAASGFSPQGASDGTTMASQKARTDPNKDSSSAANSDADGIDPAEITSPSMKGAASGAHAAGREADHRGAHEKGGSSADAADTGKERGKPDGVAANAAAKGSETASISPTGGRLSGPARTVVSAIASDPRWRPENVGAPTQYSAIGKPAAGTTLQIQLNPGHLGKVNATMRMVGSQLSVELSADTEAAAKHLATDRKEIENALRDLGFDLDQLIITPPQVVSPTAQASTSAADGGAFQRPGNEAGGAFGGARQNGQAPDQSAQGGTNAAGVGAPDSGSPVGDRSAGVYI